jgi:DNA modification methylase
MKKWPADRVERKPVDSLVPYAKNARTHSDEQVAQIADSIERYGFTVPVLMAEDGGIIAGHGRVMAAKRLGLSDLPVMTAEGWTDAERQAYRLIDNKLALNAGWDENLLRTEFAELEGLGFDLGQLGFSPPELAGIRDTLATGLTDPDDAPAVPADPVATRGDLWALGRHLLLCGDATEQTDVERVLKGTKAKVCLTDPPYGIGLSYSKFDDTKEAVSELAKKWLPIAIKLSSVVVFSPGVTRQWLYPEPSWVICWFYAGGPHRSPWGFNCWQPFVCYGKDPSLAGGRGAKPDAVDLNVPANAADINHPCPKPIKLWEWLIGRLSFEPGDLILDPFCGSGSGIIAAEMTARKCCAIEIDPAYVDVAIMRWQNFTGEKAKLGGKTFEQIAKQRKKKAA